MAAVCAGRDGGPTDQLNVTIRGRKKQEISSTGHKTTLERQFSSYADASRKKQPLPNKSKRKGLVSVSCIFFPLCLGLRASVGGSGLAATPLVYEAI